MLISRFPHAPSGEWCESAQPFYCQGGISPFSESVAVECRGTERVASFRRGS